MRVYSLLALLLLPSAAAADVIPTDLLIQGEYAFDDASAITDGLAFQAGTIVSRVGGVETTTTYTGTNTTGTNPLTVSQFTMHGGGVAGMGDGFGGTAIAIALPFGEFRADTDQVGSGLTPFTITNNSVTTDYLVTMSFQFDHSVTADGFDGFVRSDIEVNQDGSRRVVSEIISDVFFGNEINEVFTGDFGGNVTAQGVVDFDVRVGTGETVELDIDFTLENDFALGLTSGDATYFLSVNNIQAIPEPHLALMSALPLLAVATRRRRWC